MKRGELRTLYCTLADTPLLSIYLDGSASDPAMNGAWRLSMASEAERARRVTERRAPRQVEQFDRALALAREELSMISGRLPTDGLVLFVSPVSVLHREEVHVPLPTRMAWKKGPLVEPFLRALPPDGLVLVADVALDEASLYRYDGGRSLALLTRFEVEATHEAVQSVGVMKSVKGMSGFRGPSAHDEADRAIRDDRRRMLSELETSVSARMGPQDHLLLFGSQAATGELVRMLRPAMRRSVLVESLEARHSESTLIQASRRGMATLAERDFRTTLDEVRELAHRDGRGALGTVRVRRAANRGAVDTLLLSESYGREHPDVAESLIRATFRNGGAVLEHGGDAGGELDDVGVGVAARLRFAIT